MLASRTSRWVAGTVAGCVAVLVATWFLLVAPKRADEAGYRDQQVAAQQSNDALRVKVAQLRAQFAQLPQTRAELDALHKQLTPALDLPGLVREISDLSADAGTDLTSITPGTPTKFGAAAGGGAAPAARAAAGSSGSSSAAASKLVVVPISVMAAGDYYQVVNLVRQLQTKMTRALLITDIKISRPEENNDPTVKLELTGDVFVLPDGATGGAAGGATAGATGGAGGSATVSGGAGSAPGASAAGSSTVR